jgi:hypothetical protein
MRTAETVLGVIQDRGRRKLPLEDIYRQLYNPNLYLRAYARLYAKEGAMTPGATEETVDGMSLAKIEKIIEELRNERYRWTPVRRTYTEKKNSKKKRPLGIPIPRSHCTSIQWTLGFGRVWAARAAQAVYHRLITLSSGVTNACAPACVARR